MDPSYPGCCAAGDGRVAQGRAGAIARAASRDRTSAFTLVELMVVIGIAMVLLTLAVPAFVRRLGSDSVQKAVNDVMDICRDARAHAILRGSTVALRIHPPERTFEIVVLGKRRTAEMRDDQGQDLAVSIVPERSESTPPSGVTRVVLNEAIQVEGLGVNGEDWTDDPVAEVRFFPNGTCDEMSIVLLSRKNERRNIWLEVVTALAEVETDITRFKAR